MQGTSDQASIVGFDLVPVRVGVGGARRQSREHYRVHRTNVNIADKEVSQFSDEITVNCAPLV